MRDLADYVGVSRQLVSLIVRGEPGPSADSRDRVLAAAEELGFHANASARLLRQQRTRLIGVPFNLRNPFETKVVDRLFTQAPDHGFGVVLGPITREGSTERLLAELLEQRIEALVGFIPDPGSVTITNVIRRMPVVMLGEQPPSDDFDSIHIDDAAALRLAVEHLVSLGHSDIAYADGDDSRVGRDRQQAYRSAMRQAGLGSFESVVGGGWGEEFGASAARSLLTRTRGPSAVVCCSDSSAAGLLAVLVREGVRVPEDMSIIGFDDSYVARLSYHDLTSIRQDVDATVGLTVARVLARIGEHESAPRSILTSPQLIVRGSTGPAPAVGRSA